MLHLLSSRLNGLILCGVQKLGNYWTIVKPDALCGHCGQGDRRVV